MLIDEAAKPEKKNIVSNKNVALFYIEFGVEFCELCAMLTAKEKVKVRFPSAISNHIFLFLSSSAFRNSNVGETFSS